MSTSFDLFLFLFKAWTLWLIPRKFVFFFSLPAPIRFFSSTPTVRCFFFVFFFVYLGGLPRVCCVQPSCLWLSVTHQLSPLGGRNRAGRKRKTMVTVQWTSDWRVHIFVQVDMMRWHVVYLRCMCARDAARFHTETEKLHLTAPSVPKNTFTLYHLVSFFSLLFPPRSLATVYIFFVPAPCCVSLPSLFQWQAPPLSPCQRACHLGGKW